VTLSTDLLGRRDAVGLAELVSSGEASPLELVDAAIHRIEELDPGINAVIHRTFEKARAAAQSPDLPDGPFRGVPFLLKDLWPTSAGDPFHMGMEGAKQDGYIHPSDSNLVAAYRRAGFIILGRTNTPEMGLTATTEPVAYGPTRNPWDTNRGTGGSSGGSAAAVAAGMIPAANASDGGGSIRIPAAMCGLVGLKPSRGRVSMGPLRDEWGLSVQHVVCHTVRDSAAILDATAYPFPGDGVIAPDYGRPYAARDGSNLGRLRIGLVLGVAGVDTHPDCAATAQRGAAILEGLGHTVEMNGPAALESEEEQTAFTTLWAAGAAADLASIGRMLGRELTSADVEPGTWFTVEHGREVSGVDLAWAQGTASRYRREMSSWWAEGWDLLLTPTTLRPQPEIGELTSSDEEPLRAMIESIPYAALTSPFNITGQPAISLPMGHSEGLPLGAQLVAAYGREDLLFDVAAQLEAEVGWAAERAPLHP
jgi:amidase